MVKLVVATGLSRTLVMKTGEGFMATAVWRVKARWGFESGVRWG